MPYLKRNTNEPGWQWDFLLQADKYKGRIALGANRIGKSRMGAYECALAVTGYHPIRKFPDKGICWIVGLDNNMVRDIDRPLFEELMPKRFLQSFSKKDNIWTIAGEGREWLVQFKSTEMGAAKFQGAKVDLIWFDEEPKDTDVFSESMPRLIDRAGIWIMTATPVRGTKWLLDLSRRKDVFHTFAGMRDNPHIPLAEVEKLARELPDDERAVRIDGEYIVFGGRPVFDRRLLIEQREQARALSPDLGELVRSYRSA